MKQAKIVNIMRTLLPEENRNVEQVNICIEDLEKEKTGDSVDDYFIGCFISLCKYLNGYEIGLYEVPKEIRVWFLEEFKISAP